MAIKLSEQVRSLFSVYTGAINDEVTFTHLVNNCADMLGQQKVTTEDGQWKCGAGFKLKAKDSHTLQLPPNNPSTPLFYFALRLNEITSAGKFIVNASIPEMCLDYVKQSHIKAHVIAKKQETKPSMSKKDIEKANPVKA